MWGKTNNNATHMLWLEKYWLVALLAGHKRIFLQQLVQFN